MKGLSTVKRQSNSANRCAGAIPARSLRPKADWNPNYEPAEKIRPVLNLQPMSDLNLAIRNGWGDTPQSKLPPDWRQSFNAKGKR